MQQPLDVRRTPGGVPGPCCVRPRAHALPLRLVPFLDSAAERIVVRKVGGGSIVIHRMLLDDFASLHTNEEA